MSMLFGCMFWFDMPVIWESAIGVLRRSGFIPTEQLTDHSVKRSVNQRRPETDSVTLFEAIRLASGVQWDDMDSSVVTFWNWLELRLAWTEVWSALDSLVSKAEGAGSRAIPWAYQSSRTQGDVVGLLERAKQEFPEVAVPLPHRRPEARDMVSSGRIDAAIANTLGVLRVASGQEYGDLLTSCLGNGTDDEKFLRMLDTRLLSLKADLDTIDPRDLIPRQLVRARQETASRDETVRTFGDFLTRVDSSINLSGNSDSSLLHRLLSIAPEKSAAVLKTLQATSDQP